MKLTKSENICGVLFATALFFITLGSTWFFLGELSVSIPQWIVMNSCAPISFLYLLCFAIYLMTGKSIQLSVSFLPIWFLGTMGMFYVPWNDETLIAHVGHIIMTLNIGWVLCAMITHKEYKNLAIGLLISILWSVPYIAYVILDGKSV